MHRRMLIGLALALTMTAAPLAQQPDVLLQEAERLSAQQAQERERAKEREAQERARAIEQEAKERARAQEQEREKREAAGGQPVNVRLELTIRDQRGTAQPVTKTVSMVLADRAIGRVRTSTAVRSRAVEGNTPSGFTLVPVNINVDGRATVLQAERIRVSLTLEYRPVEPEGGALPHVSETIETILENGKPLVISRSADPDSDRSVTVEVKATILK